MSPPVAPLTALVLAGSRGATDSVAAHAGYPHKCLVPVAGVPMLLRVVRTLRATPLVGRILLCADDAVLQLLEPAALAELDGADIERLPTAESPSASLLAHFRDNGASLPLLVTTADHPLLTPAMIQHLWEAAPAGADVVAALADVEIVLARYPEAVRTIHRFAGRGYSGCNLFLLRTAAAARAVGFWRRMERHRKQPWRIAAAVGPITLARVLLGWLTLDKALRRLSRAAGAEIRVVEMPYAEAAIDVDKPADLALAERILRRAP